MRRRSILFLGILFLVIGFATVTTTLVISSKAMVSVNKEEFDVYFSKVVENGSKNNGLIQDDTHISFTHSMSLVGEKYVLNYDVTNGSREYDAHVAMECTNNSRHFIITNVFDTTTILPATETRTGTLTIELASAVTEDELDINISCEIVGSAISREEVADGTPADKVKSAWKITEDNDSNGEVSVGDLITLGSESFYVYNIEGDNVSAIARYNLHVGGTTMDDSWIVVPIENPTGLQDPSARGAVGEVQDNWSMISKYPFTGVVPFTTEEKYNQANEGVAEENKLKQNDYSISLIKEHVDEYATKLAELDGEVKTTRLITKEELESVGCDSNKYSCKAGYDYGENAEDPTFAGAPEYMYSTSYWTSSPSEKIVSDVFSVYSTGNFGSFSVGLGSGIGVRPVIEISKSLF